MFVPTVFQGATSVIEVPENRIPAACAVITSEMLPLVQLSQKEIETIVSGVPGGTGNVQDIYPLTPLQESILFPHLADDRNSCLAAMLMGLDNRARLDAYVGALQAVIERHDILRTAIRWKGLREPVQVVWRKAVLPFEEVELDAAGGDADEQLYALFDPRYYRIDVHQSPPLRLYVAEDKKKGRWLMMLLLHHLAGAHLTLELMQAEIQAYLSGQAEQVRAALPLRNLVAQARLGVSQQEHEEFFRQLLADVEEPTAPFGLFDAQRDATGIEEACLELDRVLTRRLRARARELGVSAASLLHVAWAQVLARVSGSEDVVFGTVLSTNTLPVRVQIGKDGVEATVRRTHALLVELGRHEHASLPLAQRCSKVAAPTPLFSALLNCRHSEGATGVPVKEPLQLWEGIECLRAEKRSMHLLTLTVDDLAEGFRLSAQAHTRTSPSRVCKFMRRALESLAEALAVSPGAAVYGLEVLPEEERRQVLDEWNNTHEAYSSEKCVHELFEEQVEKTPEAVAVVYEKVSLSYAELNRRANRLAHYLRTLGVRADTRVGICVDRGLEMLIGLLGVLKAGGAYVPMDPVYPVERLRFMLEDSAPAVLLTQSHLESLFTGFAATALILDLDDATPPWKDQPDTNPNGARVGLTPEHLAYVIYTSGSTGSPKGVMIEHRSLSNYLHWANNAYYRQPGSGSPAVHSIGFDGIITTLFGPIIAGQTLTLLRQGNEMESLGRSDGSAALPYTLIKLTPSHLKLLNRAIPADRDTAPTRILMIGGEALVPSDVLVWQRRFPDVRLVNHFGPTETTVGCCTYEIASAVTESHSIPIGRPIANTRMYILNKRSRKTTTNSFIRRKRQITPAGTAPLKAR